MAYTTAEARGQILDVLGEAIEHIALAMACVSEAYDMVDDSTAERLEGALFRPVQLAYGRAKRTYADFAARYELPERSFEQRSPGAASQTTQDLLAKTADSAAHASQAIAGLQDSMLPVEAGDPELRASLTEVRQLLGEVPAGARGLARTIGR